MSILYDRIVELCESHGISGYKLCKDTGMTPSIITDLKMGRKEGLSAKNADKIATYFGVSVGYLLGTETEIPPAPATGRKIDDADLMFALWGDTSEVTEEDLEDVRRYAAFVRERKKQK